LDSWGGFVEPVAKLIQISTCKPARFTLLMDKNEKVIAVTSNFGSSTDQDENLDEEP